MNETDPNQNLCDSLRSLDATGSDGLEGLVRKLLEKWTGQRFYLSRSGDQSGADMASLDDGNGIQIRCDTKRYGKRSHHNTRELLGEIDQSVRAQPDMDVWILFTSNEVPTQLAQELLESAREKSIETLIIDAADGSHSLVSAFCSRYPDTVIDHFAAQETCSTDIDKLSSALADIQAATETLETQRVLEKNFSKMSLGIADTARRSHEWLIHNFLSNENAYSELGQPLGVRDPNLPPPIKRREVFAKLDQWWTEWNPRNALCSLLGEEGHGKTWAAATWIAKMLNSKRADFPITVFITYSRFEGDRTDLHILIPKQLKLITGQRDSSFWGKRLRNRWLPRLKNGNRPGFLIVFDGINERPNTDWRSIARQLFGDEWEGTAAVLMTARPTYWSDHMGGEDRAITITVPEYNDQELSLVLGQHGKTTDDIPPALRDLVKKPRYCDLVIEHSEKMSVGGHRTKEWLLYLDWKDRLERKSTLPMTDAEFHQTVRNIGKKVRSGQRCFHQNDLLPLLPKADPEGEVLQELIEGTIFAAPKRKGAAQEIDHDRLVYALGFLLAEDLEGEDIVVSGEQKDRRLRHATECLDRWLEPHQEMDLKGEILGAAIFAALMLGEDSTYPDPPLQALVRRWLGAQNLPETVQQTINGYAPRLAKHYINAAEYFWTDRSNAAAEERLLLAFLYMMERDVYPQDFVDGVNLFLGIWRLGDPSPIVRGETPPPSSWAKLGKRLNLTISGPGFYDQFGFHTEAIDGHKRAPLIDLALKIISMGKPSKFAKGIITWSIARAIEGYMPESREMNWIIRLAPGDWQNDMINCLISISESHEIEVLKNATTCIAQCVDDNNSRRSFGKLRRSTQAESLSRISDWRRKDCPEFFKQDSLTPRIKVRNSGRFSYDYNIEYDEEIKSEVINNKSENAFNDKGKSWNEKILMRTAPNAIAKSYRSTIRKISTSNKWGQEPHSTFLDEALILADERTFSSLSKAHYNAIQERLSDEQDKQMETNLAMAVIAAQETFDQVETFLSRPQGTYDQDMINGWLRPLNEKSRRHLFSKIDLADIETTTRALWLLSRFPLTLTSKECGHIRPLLFHTNKALSREARNAAASAKQDKLASALYNSGVSCGPNATNDTNNAASINLLAYCPLDIPFSALAERMDIGNLGLVLEKRGNLSEEVDEYADRIRSTWENESSQAAWQRLNFTSKALQPVCERHPGLAHMWAKQAPMFVHQRYTFYRALIPALFETNSILALESWKSLRLDTGWKTLRLDSHIEDSARIPFAAPPSAEATQACDLLLDNIWSDMGLLDIAILARVHNRTKWLDERIEALVNHEHLWRRAKGLTLAAFANKSDDQWNMLWKQADVTDCWVGDLKDNLTEYQVNEGFARHWYQQYLNHPNCDHAWAAYHLMKMCIDKRFWVWQNEYTCPLGEKEADFRMRFIRSVEGKIQSAINNNTKNWGNVLFCTSISKDKIHPFL